VCSYVCVSRNRKGNLPLHILCSKDGVLVLFVVSMLCVSHTFAHVCVMQSFLLHILIAQCPFSRARAILCFRLSQMLIVRISLCVYCSLALLFSPTLYPYFPTHAQKYNNTRLHIATLSLHSHSSTTSTPLASWSAYYERCPLHKDSTVTHPHSA